VNYIKGKANIADLLSRLVSCKTFRSGVTKCQEDVFLQVRTVVEHDQLKALTAHEIERVSEKDVEMTKLFQCVTSGKFDTFGGHKVFEAVKGELGTLGKLVLRDNRIVLPESLRLIESHRACT
jgi:hypothetical protein